MVVVVVVICDLFFCVGIFYRSMVGTLNTHSIDSLVKVIRVNLFIVVDDVNVLVNPSIQNSSTVVRHTSVLSLVKNETLYGYSFNL